jgi:hypothetical protein
MIIFPIVQNGNRHHHNGGKAYATISKYCAINHGYCSDQTDPNYSEPAAIDPNEAVAYYSSSNPELESNEIYGIENVRVGRDKRRHNYQDQVSTDVSDVSCTFNC